jgi:hypothetical protein
MNPLFDVCWTHVFSKGFHTHSDGFGFDVLLVEGSAKLT